jgi:hypothetical protein
MENRIGHGGAGQLEPDLVPSLSIAVAGFHPRLGCAARANSTALMPVARRPPWVKISQRPVRNRFGINGARCTAKAQAVSVSTSVGGRSGVERHLVRPASSSFASFIVQYRHRLAV